MAIAESILPEFDHEMQLTRKVLERIPEAAPDWRPHEKSTPIGKLAMHLATLPSWTQLLEGDEFNFAPADGERPKMPSLDFHSTSSLLEAFDEQARIARQALTGMSDEKMMEPWSLKNGDHTIFTMPRAAVIRSMVLNHMIHHRAQLSVYLRLNDIPVPSIYGPSADEQPHLGR